MERQGPHQEAEKSRRMTSVAATGAFVAGATGGAATADKPTTDNAAHAAARRNDFIRGSVVF